MSWLYRYLFRGIGVVMLVGMITILLLAVMSQTRRAAPPGRSSVTGASR
jgi:Na+-transporting methylmalonyl-CoA/oxaloacetate decarboxylase gamma subunit